MTGSSASTPRLGRLRAEAGASLSQVRAHRAARVVSPTTPGTRFVTLGGAVANDVHGKNHHRAGTFGANVLAIGLHAKRRTPHADAGHGAETFFRATLGGLGLTGVIEWVEIALVADPQARSSTSKLFRSRISKNSGPRG